MKHLTYKELYRAHLGVIDEKNLTKLRNEESDSFSRYLIDLITEKDTARIEWDVKPFTVDFLSGSPRKRLDETFFAFVLRTAAIIKEESYVRTYKKPESHQAVVAWIDILRNLVVCALGLLYDVKWTPETLLGLLEPTLLKMFNESDGMALRRLMKDLGVQLAQEEPYPSELAFEKLNFLQINQFGSFYWRFLHWMAEADELRTESSFYKTQWRQLLKEPLYRTLRCGICMIHFQKMLKENEDRLVSGSLPQLFFQLHNQTHAHRRESYKFLQEPDYTEDMYRKDAEFMRQALTQP